MAQNTISVPTQVIPGSMEAAESREGRQFAEDYNQRGVEFYEAERYEEATAQFERAIALDPDNGLYHCNLAVACGERGDTRRALDEYQMALKLNPSDLTARLNLGYTYGLQGRIDLARESWNQLIQIAPESPEAEEARDNLNGIEQ